jgi:hypothetical protein
VLRPGDLPEPGRQPEIERIEVDRAANASSENSTVQVG